MYTETGIHGSKSKVQQIILPIDSTQSLGSRRAVFDPAYENVPYLTKHRLFALSLLSFFADGTEGSLIHPVGACSKARVRCYALGLENNRFVA